MCMVIDTSSWGDFFSNKEDAQPIHDWINRRGGRLVYSEHSQIKKEMGKPIKKFSQSQKQAGKNPLKIIPEDKVEKEIEAIKKNHQLQSNDHHILALARVGRAKLLCSKDKNLHKDFRKIINGKVYQNKNHKDLLTQNACPT